MKFSALCSVVACAAICMSSINLVSASDDGLAAIRDISRLQVEEKSLRDAVASRTLTWLTGTSTSNDYVSVGRIANYFGFVGLRVASGQSLTRSAVANDTLSVLNPVQRNALISLLQEQIEPLNETQSARFMINRALENLLAGDSYNADAFGILGQTYGATEAELGRTIGQSLGDIAQSLTSEQMNKLRSIRAAHISGQAFSTKDQRLKLQLPREDKQELVNLAARFLSWTTGSLAFNDFEVVGKPSQHFGFVSLRVESNHGVKRGHVAKEVLALLTPEQHRIIDTAVNENADLFGEFLQERARLMRTLEVALAGEVIDSEKVQQFGAAVGELEARMTWSQATAMLAIRDSLSAEQSESLLALRRKYTAESDDSIASSSLDRGQQLFAQCLLCHQTTARQLIAPDLSGIVGRKIAADRNSYDYSKALLAYADKQSVWSEEALNKFLESPKSHVPGTYMGFDGLAAADDRSALIDYLNSMD